MHLFKKSKFFFGLLAVILTIPIFFPLLRQGFFPMQDDLQAFRVHQIVKCLEDLQIPCRWVPDMGYQYGYPQFNYYPPSIFYLGGLLHLLGIQIIDTVKILFILGSIFSTLTMFIFLWAFFNYFDSTKNKIAEGTALVGALLYSYLPYKAAEIYVRGALSEFWSFVFFPLIFWALFQLITTGKIKYISYLAISIGLLLTTHNLMSFIFFPIFGVWCLMLLTIFKEWKLLPKILIGSLLGLGFAAFFTLPMLFEGKYVHLETLTGGYFDWRQHFVNVYQLFLSNHFGYGSSYLGPNDDLTLSVGIIQWVLAAASVIFAILFFRKHKIIGVIILVFVLIELLILFLMHQKSTFIWERIAYFSYLQFPWRFLSDSGFLLSFIGAAAIYLTASFNKRYAMFLGALVIIGLLFFYASFFQPKSWLNISDTEKFSGDNWDKQLTISIFDYLPKFAQFPPTQKAPELPDTLEGKVDFKEYIKGSNFQEGKIVVHEQAVLRLPLFYFPGMKVFIDGKEVAINYKDCRREKFCLGLITVQVPVGDHIIKAVLTDTNIRSIGNVITVLSILTIGFILKKDEKIFN